MESGELRKHIFFACTWEVETKMHNTIPNVWVTNKRKVDIKKCCDVYFCFFLLFFSGAKSINFSIILKQKIDINQIFFHNMKLKHVEAGALQLAFNNTLTQLSDIFVCVKLQGCLTQCFSLKVMQLVKFFLIHIGMNYNYTTQTPSSQSLLFT